MITSLSVLPFGRQAKVNQMNVHVLKDVLMTIIACLWDFLSITEKNIIGFQIIINDAALMQHLECVHQG